MNIYLGIQDSWVLKRWYLGEDELAVNPSKLIPSFRVGCWRSSFSGADRVGL